jgi:hypothetical protein
MGPIRCPETSVKDYHSTLRNTAEERKISSISWRKPKIKDFLVKPSPAFCLRVLQVSYFSHESQILLFLVGWHIITALNPILDFTSSQVLCWIQSKEYAALREGASKPNSLSDSIFCTGNFRFTTPCT